MTKKDYIKIAAVLNRSWVERDIHGGQDALWTNLRARFAAMLEGDNPRFDWDRFYTATEKEGS